jgi:uncharacterized membrane protein
MFGNFQEKFNGQRVRAAWQGLSQTDQTNISEAERLLSVLGGSLIALYLSRRSFGLIALLMLGGYLIYRVLTGYCLFYKALQISTASPARLRFDDEYNEHPESTVNNPRDETVWESFPASDPPASW